MIKCKYLIVYSKNSRGLKTVTVRNNQNHYCSNFFIKDLTIDICQRGSYFKLKINCRSILRKQWIKPVTIDTCQRFLNSIKGKNLWTFLFHSDTKCNGIHDFTSTVALTVWNFNLIACNKPVNTQSYHLKSLLLNQLYMVIKVNGFRYSAHRVRPHGLF